MFFVIYLNYIKIIKFRRRNSLLVSNNIIIFDFLIDKFRYQSNNDL